MNTNNWPTLQDIEDAHQRIKKYIHNTPILTCTSIDRMAGCNIYFKCENFQKVGAFKARGAANALIKLHPGQLKKGVATHSSGNHAAALARTARELGTKAYIVMPDNAPEIKKNAVKEYGGEIIFCEPNLQARESTLRTVVENTGATFIPPYDFLDIIEGQATCALEIWQENSFYDAIIAPVGGGGLLAGTALVTHYIQPKALVYGAEPSGADDAYRSLKAGRLIPMVQPKTIGDGLLTSLGKINFSILQKHVREILTVEDPEIIRAMKLVYERMKIIIEPSSAVALAAVLKNREVFEGKSIAVIFSGGNVDLTKLPF